MRETKVGVAIVVNESGQFLLTFNPKWKVLSLPMRDVGPDEDVLTATALHALEDDLGQRLPEARALELGYVGKFGLSGRNDEETLYQYWAYEIDLGQQGAVATTPDKTLRWMTPAEILAASDVSWSAQEIVRAFVDNQEVCLAVVTRLSERETEYLLTWNANYGGYFFPSMRIKQEFKPDVVARAVVRSDLGYRGEVLTTNCGAVEEAHFSTRFGRRRAYRFHVCRVALPSLDLNQPLNVLERRLQARGVQWRWLTAEELRKPAPPVSPTLNAVRAAVVQALPPTTRDQHLRESQGGIALICRTINGESEFLAQWNDNWKAFFFVGGHVRPTETFRNCVIRETEEELNVQSGVDFHVKHHEPRARLEYTAYSQSAGTDTKYAMELFEVALTDEGLAKVETDQKNNRWLTVREIERLEACDGRPVSVTMPMLLAKAGLIAW